MKALITGKTKLAGAITSQLHDTIVYQKLEIESCRVESEIPWKYFDIFINNAAVGFSQVELLHEAYENWKDDPSKLIINISSRAAEPNISKGYLYAAAKAGLNHLADNLNYNSAKRCGIVTINLGLIEHEEVASLSYENVVDTIKDIIFDWYTDRPTTTKFTLEHRENYQEVQKFKEELRQLDLDFELFKDNST
tara:strand:+ start:444 stop:1025 length:582 start_codon:yes stop_codon:yes gene_type:complete